MSRDQELWACALWVEKQHGEAGPSFIGEKIKRLALEGDFEGVATWRAIADRYDTLVDGVAGAARQ
ncbi:hypothetical protein OLX23_23625 [Novosphingobium sp. JCM 18896]|nr:hypothetical protein [Novosphingobium sp. JCM 18896]